MVLPAGLPFEHPFNQSSKKSEAFGKEPYLHSVFPTMKKLTLVAALSGTFVLQAQTFQKCYSKKAVDYQQLANPGYKTHVDEQFELARQWSAENGPVRSLYTIPVVFHIVYNTPQENLPDSVVHNQLAVMNADYARLNSDTVNMRSEFSPMVGNTRIQFVLAGITRTQTAATSFGSFSIFLGDFTDLEKVKSTADGGVDAWDQSRYLNIWVCDMSVNNTTFLLGYATPPDNLPNWPAGSTPELGDGVVLQYQCVGSNNPNDLGVPNFTVLGRTAVHETGHYLGLRHIWGDGDCTQDDGISDTPDATEASQQDCDPDKNTCDADVMGLGDLHDMIENFMDYSAETCQNSFTEEQAALMHGVLENQRYDLVHNNPAGLAELSAGVSCYPNPASGSVQVVSSSPMETLTLFDLNGKTLLSVPANGTQTTLDLYSFQTGIVVLQVRLQSGVVAQQRITIAQ
jgi:hypothetical protein